MSEIKRKPRFRISLRAMMVLVLIAGGSIGWKVHRARTQARVVEMIVAGAGSVSYDYQETDGPFIDSNAQPWAPLWLRKQLGDEYFREVTRAHLGVPTPETWAGVAKLDHLIRIDLKSNRPVAGIAGLRSLSRLRFVSIGHDRQFYCLNMEVSIDHASIEEVASIPNLQSFTAMSLNMNAGDLRSFGTARNIRELDLDCGCNDRSLHDLAPILPNLEHLTMLYAEITDRGMAELEACTSLKTLRLCGVEITDAGLAHLAGLPSLEDLTLRGARISDAGLVHLRKMRSLKRILTWQCQNTITKAGVDSLKAERPSLDCTSLYPPTPYP